VTRLKIFETCPSRSHATLPFLILRTLLYPTSLLLPCSPGLHGYPIRLFSLKTDMYVYYGLRMDGRTVCFFFSIGSARRRADPMSRNTVLRLWNAAIHFRPKKFSPHMLSTFLSLLSFSERIHFHVKRDYLSVWTAFCSIPLLSVNISCVSCHFMYAAAYSIIWIGLAGHRWRNYVFLSRWKIMYFVYVFLTYEYTTSMTCPSNRQTGRQADRYRANDHAAIISVE